MKGHVPTPDDLANHIVARLFRDRPPEAGDRILYPGAGDCPFGAAVERICSQHGWPLPEGHAVELDPAHADGANARELEHVTYHEADVLALGNGDLGLFDYVVGNPPYVAVEGLSEQEKDRYRSGFQSASGRMDLYFLFFEQGLRLLREGGLLSFITPEKWTYVGSAASLRKLLGRYHIETIEHVPEDAFEGYITYPAITTIRKGTPGPTGVTLRSGETYATKLPATGESWASRLRGADQPELDTGGVLGDAVVRISAGVATGRDRLFVMDKDDIPGDIEPQWVRPTVGGRELGNVDLASPPNRFLCPYADNGQLHEETDLGAYGTWAKQHRDELETRFCVSKNGKPWYSWHENPPMTDILRPKILFKDVASEPKFWVDETGEIVPRHSVYYGVPKRGVDLFDLADYLNSQPARAWMERHCQRAANGYIRLQSRVLKKMPIPKALQVEGQVSMAL
jgi:adenine-specific DNA-methyltransferase